MADNNRSWTYEQLTQMTRWRIQTLLERRPFATDESIRVRRQWAYGVFLAWHSITIGWQRPVDVEAMEALVNGDGQ
jgi:hypothetical protein